MSDEKVDGWKLVSVEPSQFQIQSIQAQTGCNEATARLFWSKLLYWASEPPALSAHGQPVVDEAAQGAIADILNHMESWSKAYPVEVFHEPTQEERDWLHKTRPGLMECIAARMGRHMAKCMADDLAKLTAALTGATP